MQIVHDGFYWRRKKPALYRGKPFGTQLAPKGLLSFQSLLLKKFFKSWTNESKVSGDNAG